MTKNPRPGDQQLPEKNDSPSIQSLILDEMTRLGKNSGFWKLIRTDIREREKIGVERYGTALQAHNGRDAIRDAYEEALDGLFYVRQALQEDSTNSPLRHAYSAQWEAVLSLRQALGARRLGYRPDGHSFGAFRSDADETK